MPNSRLGERCERLKKKAARATARQRQHFRVLATPRVYIVESKFKPEWPAPEASHLEDIPSNCSVSIACIPDPNYRADIEISRYAAVRFPKSVSDEDQLVLLSQIQELKVGVQ